MRRFYVYLLTNARCTVFYVGVTNNVQRRVAEHKRGLNEGFTKRYGVHRLVYYEVFDDALTAIRREKQLKRWRRSWKVELVRRKNSGFQDLSIP